MNNQTYRVGQKAFFRKTITETDIVLCAAITGDFNPLHTDDVFAKSTRFGRRIAHGSIAAGLISTVIGMHLPGPGTVCISHSFNFLKPVFVNDTIKAEVEIIEIAADPLRMKLSAKCINADEQCVLDGVVVVTVTNFL
jgi:3-hydroxybutyryl-CoA dehydratase